MILVRPVARAPAPGVVQPRAPRLSTARSMPVRRLVRRFFAHFAFALLLVFGQQQAFAHALEHDFARIHRDAAPAGDDQFCAKCLAVAHLGHGTVSGTVTFDAEPATPPRVAHVLREGVARLFETIYLTRAPPVFS
jgi:hypothetical protein